MLQRNMTGLLIPLFLFACISIQAGEVRQWTGSNGKVIEAEFLGLEGDIVKLKLKNGRESNVLITNFSKEDQEYIKKIAQADNPFDEAKDDTSSPATDESHEELLGSTTFEGSRLDQRYWNWTPMSPIASMSIENKMFKIATKKETPTKPERLQAVGFRLDKDKTYRFTVEIKADKKTDVQIKAESTDTKPLNLGLAESIQVDTEWKKQSLTFKALRDCPKARISFDHFNAGQVYEIRSVSLRVIEDDQVEEKTRERLGPEILPISTFSKGYVPDRNGSAWAGAPGSITNENGVLRMQVNRGPAEPSYIDLQVKKVNKLCYSFVEYA